ncbi:hypothetical protein ACFL2B_01645 [Patescibacteria group bacterium]
MFFLDTKYIIREAKKLGIKTKIIYRDKNFVELQSGKKKQTIMGTYPPQTSVVAHYLCAEKHFAIDFLKRAKLPVPRSRAFTEKSKCLAYASSLPLPVVAKGSDGSGGANVLANLKTKKDLREAIDDLFKRCETVMIEEQAAGDDYRILVIKRKAVACVKRIPANVIGDGKKNIKALISETNKDPRRGPKNTKSLVTIKIDDDTTRVVKEQGYLLNTVPPKGKQIFLKSSANLSEGGETENYTSLVHKDYFKIAEKAALVLDNIPLVGLDIITPDITRPWRETKGVIIEANDAPMLQLHQLPTRGKAINVAKMFVKLIMK